MLSMNMPFLSYNNELDVGQVRAKVLRCSIKNLVLGKQTTEIGACKKRIIQNDCIRGNPLFGGY